MSYSSFFLPPLFLHLEEEDNKLVSAKFLEKTNNNPGSEELYPLLKQAGKQLKEYLEGTRKDFEIPLDLRCSNFQKEVLGLVQSIPFGEVRSYSSLAEELGGIKKVRAVAGAIASNPLPIFIPCHRVIGKDKGLRGYLGGEKLKFWLLKHEGINLPGFQQNMFE